MWCWPRCGEWFGLVCSCAYDLGSFVLRRLAMDPYFAGNCSWLDSCFCHPSIVSRCIDRSKRHQTQSLRSLTYPLKAASTIEKGNKEMCVKLFTQYACGHAEMDFLNRHCYCALIVGPVRDVRERCERSECGGEPRDGEGGFEVRRESEGRERNERRDEV